MKSEPDSKAEPELGRIPIAGLIRQARRRTGMSQRELAVRARVAPSTVAKVEKGTIVPGLRSLEALLDAAGLFLVVVDPDGRVLQPLEEYPLAVDNAGRRYPAHLDLIIEPEPGEWWGDRYGLARPPETFIRDPESVLRRRRESAKSRAEICG
jgi:transcriptional regulator with XRE-family HTH domain